MMTTLLMTTTGEASAQADAENFYRSERVKAEKVAFPNLYGMRIGAMLFRPDGMAAEESRPAVIVGHPMGAVKEQSAVLYATKMA